MLKSQLLLLNSAQICNLYSLSALPNIGNNKERGKNVKKIWMM